MDLEKDSLLRHEQVKLLYEAMPMTIIATIINAIVLVIVGWNVVEQQLSLFWLACILMITSARLLLTLLYRRAQVQPSDGHATQWETYFTVGSISAGAIWGSASLLLFPEHSVIHQIFVAFIVGGMCAGAVTSLSPLPLQLYSFFLLALGPLIIRFFMNDSELTNTMGAMLLLFLIMIAISGLRTHRNLKQTIKLRMQSESQENIILQSKKEQQLILDHAPVGVWLIGLDGRYRFVNKTFCDTVGISEKEFLSSTQQAELLGEEMAAHCLDSDRECLEQDEPHHSHETLTFTDGKPHWLDITKVKVRDKNNRVTGIIGIASDMTERNLAEDQLRKLSQAVEQAGESIMITDHQGTIEYVNPSFTKITGYASDEVLGRNPRILKSGNTGAEYYEHLWSTISSGKKWNSTIIDRRKDGSQYLALMSIAPILDDEGEITHYAAIQQDMSMNKMLEEQFLQAQKMEALGTLVGGIAHEFNNLLAGMTGNLYLAKTEISGFPDVIKRLDNVEELGFRAAEMIKQLLTFARKGQLEIKAFNLTSFVKDTSQLIEATLPENIKFHSNLCHDKLIIKGDVRQLQQVLMNLISNARDAVEGVKEPVISFKTEAFKADAIFCNNYPDIEDKLFAHLIVKDNGSGISDDEKEHIFEPFYSTKEVGLGTGLGLSMAYGAIQSHHGIIDVDNSIGIGSAFHIYLPLITEGTPEPTAKKTSKVVPGNGEFILIVDDNAIIRTTCSGVLEKIGYQVIEAADGLEAIEKFTANQETISLIIMDIIMPNLGGVQAVERIKEHSPAVKVIFATGYDKNETLQGDMPSDEYPIIFKPFSIVKLSQIIKEQLDS